MKAQARIVEFELVDRDLNGAVSYLKAADACLRFQGSLSAYGSPSSIGHAAKGAAESLRRLGRLREAEAQYRLARACFSEARDISGLCWTSWAEGNLLRHRADYRGALLKLRTATSRAQDLLAYAYGLAGIAETLRIQGRYGVSYRGHQKALDIFKELEDPRGVIWAYEGMAQMWLNAGNLRRAHEFFSFCAALAPKIADLRGLGFALRGLAEACGRGGLQRHAMDHLRMAVDIFGEIQYYTGLAYTFKSKGDIALRRRDTWTAGLCYAEAEEIFVRTEDPRGLAYCAIGKGDVRSAIGDPAGARSLYHDAMAAFQEKGVIFGYRVARRRFERACKAG